MKTDAMYDDEAPEVYKYTIDEAHILRCKLLDEKLFPALKRTYFDKYPELKSALLCVAQYWNDEAYDAVHESFILSELDEPDFTGAVDCYEYDDDDDIQASVPSDPNLPTLKLISDGRTDRSSIVKLYDMAWAEPGESWNVWDDNDEAVTLWAAWCQEGSQDNSFKKNYHPAVVIKRDGTYRFKEKLRPDLDGAFSVWEQENGK